MTSDRSTLEREMAGVEIRPFTLDEFHRRRRRKQRNRRIALTVVGAVVAAAAIGGVLRMVDPVDETITADDVPGPALPPPSPFVGTWVSTDADGSSQTMEIQPSGPDHHRMVMHDDAATACAGVPATVTGTGQIEMDGRLVFGAELSCDDGSTPVPLSDPASAAVLQETLANFWFVHDPVTDELIDSLEVVWRHPGAAPDQGNAPTTVGRLAGASINDYLEEQ